MSSKPNSLTTFTSKELVTDQDVRWCPGCGDYSILKQAQTVIPELGIPREQIVFISGIGCSSRFPYYMETYGMHSIHGRAMAFASGIKSTRPELSIWVVTGDGDAMSIGGNHFIHMMRRNFNLNILLFNNQIYGLTKGQYSPTSEEGKITKSTPYGSLDHPFNPIALAMGADATFVARSMDRDPIHLKDMLRKAHAHKGASFVEIYQNCNVFNDGTFEIFTEKSSKKQETLMIEHGKPLVFGATSEKGIKLDGFTPTIVDIGDSVSVDDLWVHDETDRVKAGIISRFFDNPMTDGHFPRPFGIFWRENRKCYEDDLNQQIQDVIAKKGNGKLDDLLRGRDVWEIKA